MDAELERFRRDIDLQAFAASKGYALDKKESSVSCRMMRHANGDKIAIGKGPSGNWRYYSFRDESDNGDIIQFIQNRAGGWRTYSLGEVRKELRQWTHAPCVDAADRWQRAPEALPFDRAAIERLIAQTRLLATHPYLESRCLSPHVLSSPRFQGTWREARAQYGNVIFPHRDEAGFCGFEVKNHGFTGFSSGGHKGLWSSRTTPVDCRLVVTESAIDALSHHQLSPHPKTRYVSFGGEQSPAQPKLLDQAISWMPAGSVVVAATDNDQDGHKFAARLRELCTAHPHVKFERDIPRAKDWNDDLRDLKRQTPPRVERQRATGLDR